MKPISLRPWLGLLLAIMPLMAAAQSDTLAGMSLAQVLDSADNIRIRKHIPAVMLALVHRDSVIWSGALGMADREAQRPATGATRFRQGSISKSFAAICLLQLVREGKLSLDAKLADLAPEIPIHNPWESTDPVRVVHLLEHTAGFDDLHFAGLYEAPGTTLPALELVLRQRKSLTCRWRPGTRSSYANPGYLIAGYLVEKIGGQPWQEAASRRIFDPLGMKSNFLTYRDDSLQYAAPYVYQGDTFVRIPFYTINAGFAGALNASADDMARFVRMFLREGRADSLPVLTPDELRRMQTPATTLAAQAGLTRGYGLAHYTQHPDRPHAWYGHGGGIDGFVSNYAYAPELGLGYAISNNGMIGLSEIEDLLMDWLTAHLPPAPKPAPYPVDFQSLAAWDGYYRPVSPRNQLFYFQERLLGGLRIKVKDTTIHQSVLFQPHDTLVPTGAMTFRTSGDYAPSVIFLTDADGQQLIEAGGSLYEQVPGIWQYAAWILTPWALLGVLMMAVLGSIWVILSLFRRVSWQDTLLALPGWVGAVSAIVWVIAITAAFQRLTETGNVNLASVSVFVSSLLLAAGGLGGCWTLTQLSKASSPVWRWLVGIGTLGVMMMAAYLGAFGWIGLQLWAY
ncbi:MAG: serine hydrolase domain-containing protein [Bacteroidia bacterium]|nr:serine hydrolase domain-containing protein [Bacteroidia bacterium]